MHKEVSHLLAESRQEAVARHNRHTGVYPCNPTVGDFVVVARNRGPRTKMSANWVGPRRVVQVLSGFTVRFEHLLTNETEDIHISRVKPYTDSAIDTPVQMKEIAEYSDRKWHSFDKIKDQRKVSDGFEALVSWKGLKASGDFWEPHQVMYEYVPSKVSVFFRRKRDSKTIRKAKVALKI